MRALVIWIFAGIIGAAALHLAMILLMPRLARNDIVTRIAGFAPANSFTVLGDPGSSNLPRFADPAAIHGFCPFDVSVAPVRLTAVPGEQIMNFVFLYEGGRVFAALTDRVATRGRIDIVIATLDQIEALKQNDIEGEVVNDLRIAAPKATGVIVAKALVPTASLRKVALETLRGVTCVQEKPAE